jgi:hypothetical protein
MNSELILYTTLGCHLCEQAEALIMPLLINSSYQLTKVDIADSEDLVALYGIKIPVLKNSKTQHELCWPFTSEQIQQLVS